MSDTPHQCFTVSTTAYLRSLSDEAISERTFAIHYQDAPKKTPTGTSRSMRWPLLILAHYVDGPEAEAEKIARILNAHYDEKASLTAAATALRDAHLLPQADYQRTINRIQARERLREIMA